MCPALRIVRGIHSLMACYWCKIPVVVWSFTLVRLRYRYWHLSCPSREYSSPIVPYDLSFLLPASILFSRCFLCLLAWLRARSWCVDGGLLVCWRDVTSFVGTVRGVPVFKGNVACRCSFSMTCSLDLQRACFEMWVHYAVCCKTVPGI